MKIFIKSVYTCLSRKQIFARAVEMFRISIWMDFKGTVRSLKSSHLRCAYSPMPGRSKLQYRTLKRRYERGRIFGGEVGSFKNESLELLAYSRLVSAREFHRTFATCAMSSTDDHESLKFERRNKAWERRNGEGRRNELGRHRKTLDNSVAITAIQVNKSNRQDYGRSWKGSVNTRLMAQFMIKFTIINWFAKFDKLQWNFIEIGNWESWPKKNYSRWLKFKECCY